jgi:TPP-dependent pyruvate/acetoin dehydrogenase alpha subunit
VTPLEMLLASVGSKDDPANGGRQMPSHWGHTKWNIPSQSSATGTQCLHAIGAAEAGRLYERLTDIPDRESRFHADEVVYVSVGDGATSEGEFWESLNTACTERLPVIYLVEDNGYAISVPVEVQTPGGDISRLVEHFPSLRVFRCDGTDYPASYRTMREAVAHTRGRKGPSFVHASVIRPYSHSLSDDEKLYKTPAEREAEARRDPLVRMRALLLSEGFATEDDLTQLLATIDAEINAAADAALAAPKPEPATASLYVFSPDVDPTSSAFATDPAPSGAPDTMVSAINATLKDEMRVNPRIVVFGEDVADASREEALSIVTGKGGVFKVTHGLQRLYGGTRVFNSPIAEANIIGRGVGMALRGLEAGGRDSVLRLHLAGVHAVTRRDGDDALPLGQSLVVRHGHSACRSAATCAAGPRTTASQRWRSSRKRLASASRSRPTRRMRPDCCAPRSAATTRAVSRAQAPLSTDVQQGRLSRTGVHGAVRQGVTGTRRRRRCRLDLGRARAAVAAGRPAGAKGWHQRRRHRSANDHPVRLGDDRGVHAQDEPRHRRPRRSDDGRLRRGDRRPDRR